MQRFTVGKLAYSADYASCILENHRNIEHRVQPSIYLSVVTHLACLASE